MNSANVIAEEDQARAHCYAILGRLWYAAPDASFASYIAGLPAADGATPLGLAWNGLQEACRHGDEAARRLEYDGLFVGVGKAPVTLYTCAYVAPHAPDCHLLALRNALDGLGLGRQSGAGEAEDHISGLCDTMRALIGCGAGVAAERRFFFQFVAPAIEPLCAAVSNHPQAGFYRAAASFTQSYCEVERAAFELEGTPE